MTVKPGNGEERIFQVVIEFFMPMIPPTVTHHDKGLRAWQKEGKAHAVLYDSPQLTQARAKLHAHLAPHRPQKPMQGAVRLVVKWCFPTGKSHKNGSYKTTRPDTDNLQKALKDVMTQLYYWKDDAQVASEICEKFWADVPGIYICIQSLDD